MLSGIGAGKSYVDSSTVDEETSQRIADAVTAAGGRFLEAPVSGSKKPAEDGQLIFLTAGDESLYHECKAALEAMGKKHLFLGKTGAGARMKLVVNMVMGDMMVALSEGLSLCGAAGLYAPKPLRHRVHPRLRLHCRQQPSQHQQQSSRK